MGMSLKQRLVPLVKPIVARAVIAAVVISGNCVVCLFGAVAPLPAIAAPPSPMGESCADNGSPSMRIARVTALAGTTAQAASLFLLHPILPPPCPMSGHEGIGREADVQDSHGVRIGDDESALVAEATPLATPWRCEPPVTGERERPGWSSVLIGTVVKNE